MDSLKGKMKFLAIKLSALKSELKISREIFGSASREVESMFNKKYFPEVPIEKEENEEGSGMEEYSEDTPRPKENEEGRPDEDPGSEPIETQSANKNADPEVKKMFKKIASQIHPDKLEELEDGFEKEKKRELFEKARSALEDNDILILADVAMELGLPLPEITDEKLKLTEKKIIAIKNELSHIESTMVWHWFFTEDATQKDNILKKLFELMYANNTRS